MGWLWKREKKLCFEKMRMESNICFKSCYSAARMEGACSRMGTSESTLCLQKVLIFLE